MTHCVVWWPELLLGWQHDSPRPLVFLHVVTSLRGALLASQWPFAWWLRWLLCRNGRTQQNLPYLWWKSAFLGDLGLCWPAVGSALKARSLEIRPVHFPSSWDQIDKFPSGTPYKLALCHLGEANYPKRFTWIKDKMCICWLLFSFSIGSKPQWGKQDCSSESPLKFQHHSTAFKASADTRMGHFSVVGLAALDQQPVDLLLLVLLKGSFCCWGYIYDFTIPSCLRLRSKDHSSFNECSSTLAASPRQPLKQTLSQIALHFDWNRKINTNRLSQLYLALPSEKGSRVVLF